MSGQDWDWKQDTQFGRNLAKSTLKNFQLAAQIRAPSFRSAARCRRSTSPSRRCRCMAMPTWRCSISMARCCRPPRPATRRALIPWPGKTRLGQPQPDAGAAGPRVRNQVRRPLGVETIAGQGTGHRQWRQSRSAFRHRRARCRLHDQDRRGRQPIHAAGAFRLQLSEGFLMGNCMAGSAIAGRRDSSGTPPCAISGLDFDTLMDRACGRLAEASARATRCGERRQVSDVPPLRATA